MTNAHRTRASLFALGAALLLTPCFEARAELVRAELQGIVNASPIAALNGQTWTLSFVFDTAAPEIPFTAGIPQLGQYFNTSTVKVLREFDFSVGNSGNFTIHLENPVPATEGEVRIDIDNFASKTFFLHIDDAALLPTWNGLQLDNFMLALDDDVPGGYFDGTDRLPSADPAITIDEFTGFFNQVRLNIGGPQAQLIGTPTSFALTPVPEISTGGLGAGGALAMLLLKRLRRPREGGLHHA